MSLLIQIRLETVMLRKSEPSHVYTFTKIVLKSFPAHKTGSRKLNLRIRFEILLLHTKTCKMDIL